MSELITQTNENIEQSVDITMDPIIESRDVPMIQQQEQTQLPIEEKHTVHWFRKGLRMHDNPSLKEGLKDSVTFRCVFILDPWFAGTSNVGINKWRFLLQCLEDLDFNLRKLNSRLFVIRGQPADILPKLFKEWKITCLSFEEDPEPFGKVRDQNIMTLCRELNINVISRVSHTLYNLDLIIEKNGNKTPLTYHQFQTLVAKMEPPPSAEAPVTPLIVRYSTTPLKSDHDEKYGVPTLEELGFDIEGLLAPTWKGGETEAMRRLERHLERKAWVASFGRPKMTPQSLLASQTGLSPYLRFGCLSTRLFYYELNKLYKRIKKAPPPLSLHGQLLWREFFYCAATRNPSFDRMVGNPICVQIPWDSNVEALAKWANAQTGFPWIDAIMTQLREEGWIHHLARHAVACFLTRGDLWVSWEEGMKIFDELLLDADWSVNAGMWMWLSCSSFFQQFFHCYCPVKFGRKADPNGDYIRRYLPILKNIPTRFIHEPWIAPHAIQKVSKCVIGIDYPLPMVNHPVVSKINIERIKQVYRQLTNYQGTQINDKCLKHKSTIKKELIHLQDQQKKELNQKELSNHSNELQKKNQQFFSNSTMSSNKQNRTVSVPSNNYQKISSVDSCCKINYKLNSTNSLTNLSTPTFTTPNIPKLSNDKNNMIDRNNYLSTPSSFLSPSCLFKNNLNSRINNKLNKNIINSQYLNTSNVTSISTTSTSLSPIASGNDFNRFKFQIPSASLMSVINKSKSKNIKLNDINTHAQNVTNTYAQNVTNTYAQNNKINQININKKITNDDMIQSNDDNLISMSPKELDTNSQNKSNTQLYTHAQKITSDDMIQSNDDNLISMSPKELDTNSQNKSNTQLYTHAQKITTDDMIQSNDENLISMSPNELDTNAQNTSNTNAYTHVQNEQNVIAMSPNELEQPNNENFIDSKNKLTQSNNENLISMSPNKLDSHVQNIESNTNVYTDTQNNEQNLISMSPNEGNLVILSNEVHCNDDDDETNLSNTVLPELISNTEMSNDNMDMKTDIIDMTPLNTPPGES